MDKIKSYDYVSMVKSFYDIPLTLTNEWIDIMLDTNIEDENQKQKRMLFTHFGFCYRDLSNYDFTKVDKEHLLKVPFNSSTIFPSVEKMPKGFNPHEIIAFAKNPFMGIKELHKRGVNGEGICVATIDFGFQDEKHIEFANANIEIVDLFKDTGYHFHATGVLSNLCGKNIGIAPKARVLHYNTYQGYGEEVDKATLTILKDILERIRGGEKIRAVNISAPLLRNKKLQSLISDQKSWQKLRDEQVAPFLKVIEELKLLGCEVISSERFSKDFSCSKINYHTSEVVQPDWISFKSYSDKMTFISGGKVIPEFLSKEGYKYEPNGSVSWSIPQAVGLYALVLQINSNVTWDEFVKICKDSSKVNVNNVRIINVQKLINNVTALNYINQKN